MCKTCDILMDDYKYRVGLFKSAVRDFTGAIEDDSEVGAAEVERVAGHGFAASNALRAPRSYGECGRWRPARRLGSIGDYSRPGVRFT
jgi:hypothetical protein